VVIGNDSGPLHLAAAAKVPIISLFGATHPGRSAPYGSEALALHSPAGCSPCYRRRCPGLNTVCMLDLPPEAVLAQVEGIVQRR
jgi:ADP-heptose:LPS heptosyltransferase